jgi:glycerol-3-phosphate dehydrogenase (NAD(P)+)
MKKIIKCGVIGAGSWGTAISSSLAKKGYQVILWARRSVLAEKINEKHVNPDYLSDVSLPGEVQATSGINDLREADYIIVAIPSHAFRSIVEKFKEVIKDKIILSLTKGLEKSGLRMSQVLKEVLGEANIAVLSGPNHAEEVIREVPSATVIASENEDLARELQKLLMTPYFRVYTNPDVIGVELAGATKNVVAIAAGISDGLGYGDNTKASLMTRGLAEMMRLGVACGAHPFTFLGLSGVGDLIATCTSKHSRNRYVGEEIGKGKKLSQVISGMKMVAEGVQTAPAVKKLALKKGISIPITDEVISILYGGKDPKESVLELMLRSPKSEMPAFTFPERV